VVTVEVRALGRLGVVGTMKRLLAKMTEQKGWVVAVAKLEYLVPISKKLHQVLELTNKLIRLVYPATDLATLNITFL
jgi:hypothetical protein